MSAYWITRCHVTDQDVYNKYLDLAGPAIKKFGGKFLVRGGKQFEVEGQGFERTVLVEFSSLDLAINYAKKKKIDYEVLEPKKRKTVKKSYADNFLR